MKLDDVDKQAPVRKRTLSHRHAPSLRLDRGLPSAGKMTNPNAPNRRPISERLALEVGNLEAELKMYRGLADLYRHADSSIESQALTEKLLKENIDLKQRLATYEGQASYVDWFEGVFGKRMPVPNTWPFTTFSQGTPWSDKVVYGMQDGEILYAEHLLENLENDAVPGSIVEFGTYYGHWLQVLCETLERRSWSRDVWGFDSFEGLPPPDKSLDPDCWTEGMYAAPLEEVKARLQVDKRPWLQLVKGWFNVSLASEPARSIKEIAYARIDGDLYESCVDCLKFIDGRLADGAIVVFDDWQFSTEIGEPRAFKEWMEGGASDRYDFEYLEMNMWAHFYTKVHKK